MYSSYIAIYSRSLGAAPSCNWGGVASVHEVHHGGGSEAGFAPVPFHSDKPKTRCKAQRAMLQAGQLLTSESAQDGR